MTLSVSTSNQVWNETICKNDSDGDGKTNGQELGDPNCIWKKGSNSTFITGLSHPGKQYSFIHYGDLYSAPSRLLLRSAPNPCTAKKKSFETRVECVRKNPREQSLRQRKPIPHRGTNHRECTGLG